MSQISYLGLIFLIDKGITISSQNQQNYDSIWLSHFAEKYVNFVKWVYTKFLYKPKLSYEKTGKRFIPVFGWFWLLFRTFPLARGIHRRTSYLRNNDSPVCRIGGKVLPCRRINFPQPIRLGTFLIRFLCLT